MNEILILIAILFSVVVIFYIGFLCGKSYEKTALELTIENLNFETMRGGNWEFSKDEVEYQKENK